MKTYFAYVKLDQRSNRPKRTGVVIHLGECRYCNNGKGTRQMHGGTWRDLGVYDWPREAMVRAKEVIRGGLFTFVFCRHCIGQGVHRT